MVLWCAFRLTVSMSFRPSPSASCWMQSGLSQEGGRVACNVALLDLEGDLVKKTESPII
jgi:hypothetical protein